MVKMRVGHLLVFIALHLSQYQGGRGQCTDSYGGCTYWASVHECIITPGFMMCSCAQSCNTPSHCDPASSNDTSCSCRWWAADGKCAEPNTQASCQTTCQLRENAKCSVPPSIDHAHHSPARSEYAYLDLVEYLCNEGYINKGLIPASTLVCNEISDWTISRPDNLPVCEWIVCNTPPTIAHASFVGTAFDYNSTVIYTCDRGYEATSGSDVRKCDGTQSWSGSNIVCERVDCGPPPNVNNANVTFTSTRFEDEAIYTCHQGYNSTQTSVSKQCTEYRNWTGADIACSIVTCPAPPTVNSTEVVTSGAIYESVANYTCVKGHNPVGGDFTKVCEADGVWQGSDLICQVVSCGFPSSVSNTTTAFNSTTFLSEAKYDCIKGHKPVGGSPVKQCSENGTWIGADLQCEVVSCGPPADVEYADWSANDRIYQSQARYSCNVGYEQIGGQDVKTCTETGDWEGDNLKCRVVSCGLPPSIPNADFTNVNDTYLSTATYTCQPGYEYTGGDVIKTCDENGTWTGNDIVCSAVDCGVPPVTANSSRTFGLTTYPSMANYTCDTGYNSSRLLWNVSCSADKTWHGDLPQCSIIECGNPPDVDKSELSFTSSVYLSTATYSCIKGYNPASGSRTKTCAETGEWMGVDLLCEIVSCGAAPEVVSAAHSSTGSTYGSNVTYTCIKGHKVMGGSPTMHCTEFGVWEGDSFNCTIVSCDAAPEISNAHVTGNYTRTYQSKVTYACNLGYNVDGGNETLTCSEQRVWIGNRLRCKEKPSAAEIIGVIKKFKPEVVEASGSVGFGVGACVIMVVILTGILLLDLSTFYRHLHYMKENLTDFWESRKPSRTISLPEKNYTSEA